MKIQELLVLLLLLKTMAKFEANNQTSKACQQFCIPARERVDGEVIVTI